MPEMPPVKPYLGYRTLLNPVFRSTAPETPRTDFFNDCLQFVLSQFVFNDQPVDAFVRLAHGLILNLLPIFPT